MIYIYYIIVFFSSLLLADLNVIPLFNIGPKVYISDVFFAYFFFCFVFIGLANKFQTINRWFMGLLLVLVFSICYGIRSYGFSAIGEGRYIYWLFFFAVPIYFNTTGYIKNLRDFDKFFKLTYLLLITNILVLLIIEIINGGRFFLAPENQEFARIEDERGVRFLGSEETFHLGAAAIFLIIDQYTSKKKSRIAAIAIIFLCAVILFTKNRAALISLSLAMIIVFALEGKAKLILRLLVIFCSLFAASFLLFPSLTNSIIAPLQSIFNITEDTTGNWRLLVQAVAVQQGMQTPILGQGFGGYFEYYIESLNQTFNYPPHSIYVFLFQKSGLIGLTAYVGAIFSLIKVSSALKKYTKANPVSEKYRLLFKVLLVAQIPYGFAYDFSVYLGFYIGMIIVLKNIRKKESVKTLTYNELPENINNYACI